MIKPMTQYSKLKPTDPSEVKIVPAVYVEDVQ